jgi:hypothetical protein
MTVCAIPHPTGIQASHGRLDACKMPLSIATVNMTVPRVRHIICYAPMLGVSSEEA